MEIMLLDPDSEAVRTIERDSYSDKEAGFLSEEIRSNLLAIQRVADFLKAEQSRAAIRSWTYSSRPALRITFIDQERAFLAHYLPGSRTGLATVFFDLNGTDVSYMLEGLHRYYDLIKGQAQITS
jgi:hypothetical protein